VSRPAGTWQSLGPDRGELLLGALFDVKNPMKVSESPCGAAFTTGAALGWHLARRGHRRPAASRLRVPDRLHGHRPDTRPRPRPRGGHRTRQRGSRGRAEKARRSDSASAPRRRPGAALRRGSGGEPAKGSRLHVAPTRFAAERRQARVPRRSNLGSAEAVRPPARHSRIGAGREGALKGNKAHGRNECRSAGNGGCDTTDSSVEQGLEVGRSVIRSTSPALSRFGGRSQPLGVSRPRSRGIPADRLRAAPKGPRGLSGWANPGGGSTSPTQGRHLGAGGGCGGSAPAAHATPRRRGSRVCSMTWGSASADRSIIDIERLFADLTRTGLFGVGRVRPARPRSSGFRNRVAASATSRERAATETAGGQRPQ